MRKIIPADRQQALLFRTTIGDSLPRDHEIFSMAELIDRLDMSAFNDLYSHRGGKVYDPKVILSILLFGYSRGWRSSRQLQLACVENLAMRYLTGDLQVKFRAIAEFRVRFAKEIEDVFSQSIGIVVSHKPDVGDDVKTDGTKVVAYAANDQTYSKSKLKEMQAKLQKQIKDFLSGGIEDDIREDKQFGENSGNETDIKKRKQMVEAIIKKQKEQAKEKQREKDRQAIAKSQRNSESPAISITNEGNSETENTNLKDGFQSADCNRPNSDSTESNNNVNINANTIEETVESKIQNQNDLTEQEFLQAAQKLEKIERALEVAKGESEDAKINLTDPESRFMKNQGRITQSYNIQASSSEGFIVDIEIADNNACNDQHELSKSLIRTEKNTGKRPRESSADSGYFHASALEYLEQNDIEGFIPAPREVSRERQKIEPTGYEAHNFSHDSDKDTYLCPEGKPLHLEHTRKQDDKNIYIYRCKPEHCVPCSVRQSCCVTKKDIKSGYRSLELGNSHLLKHKMIKKMQTEEGKVMYKKRGAEIEPCFGIMKSCLNFRQLLLRGSDKVRSEVKLIGTAFNFKKLIRMKLATP